MSVNMVRLGDVLEIKGGGTPSKSNPDFWNGDIPWVSPKDMKSWEIKGAADKITQLAVNGSATSLIPTNSILLVNRSGILKHTLPVGITRRPVAINQDIKALICGQSAYPDYIAHLVKSAELVVLKWVRATTADNFPIDNLRELQVPLPPLDEQKRIAAILDKADQLRQKRRQAIALLDSLTQSIFLEMFGDRIFTNNCGIALAEVAAIQIGPFGSLLHKEDYREGGVPLVNPMHIVDGTIIPEKQMAIGAEKYTELKRYHLNIADVVLGRRGEMGRCAVVTELENGYVCGTGSMFLRPNLNKVRPIFLAALLRSRPVVQHLENASAGVTMPNLNKSVVADIMVDLPTIDLQLSFENVINRVAASNKDASVSLGRFSSLFASLQHSAFSGQL